MDGVVLPGGKINRKQAPELRRKAQACGPNARSRWTSSLERNENTGEDYRAAGQRKGSEDAAQTLRRREKGRNPVG